MDRSTPLFIATFWMPATEGGQNCRKPRAHSRRHVLRPSAAHAAGFRRHTTSFTIDRPHVRSGIAAFLANRRSQPSGMHVFIVHAHHEPASFNGAMTREASAALLEAGHEVVVSDLYAMRFDPVSDRRNFTTVADPAYLKQQAEEALASAQGGFAPSLQAEMDKLAWRDILVFQFPIWWLGMPAIMKGWIDAILGGWVPRQSST